MITTRQAVPADAEGMSLVISPILKSWDSQRRGDVEHMMENYINRPHSIRCTVAVGETGETLGFQSLVRAIQGNPYGTPMGWGIIGTYVALDSGGKGIGRMLFADSVAAAKASGIKAIEAVIGKDNPQGLGYYSAIGFQTYAEDDDVLRKKFDVGEAP